MKLPRTGPPFWSIVVGLAAAGVAGVLANRAPGPTPTVAQIQELLPAGSVLHSVARLEMGGRPPREVAVVAGVPSVPGSGTYAYYGYIFARDRWRGRIVSRYSATLPGRLPLSVDAGRLIGKYEAVLFGAAHEDGAASYRVVAMRRFGRPLVTELNTAGRFIVVDPVLVEVVRRPDELAVERVLAWNGQRFQERADVALVRLPPPGRTWYYGVRNRLITAPSSEVRLKVRQPLRISGNGPGRPGVIVVPDQGLDQVESGYRARRPGTYRIRLLLPFSTQDAFVLTVIVEDTP